MCNRDGPLRDLILRQCNGLRKLFKSISRSTPPGSLLFVNQIGAIERKVKKQSVKETELQEANRLLGALMDDLSKARDGAGDLILNGQRYKEFIACDNSI
ncbi:MAG TPA: hypothetical protein VIX91_22525 [Candidatus Acidoferrum sp.]